MHETEIGTILLETRTYRSKYPPDYGEDSSNFPVQESTNNWSVDIYIICIDNFTSDQF